MHLSALSSSCSRTVTVTADVGSLKLNLFCRELCAAGAVAEWEIENGTAAITEHLTAIRELARSRGIDGLRVVVEPTGVYHRLLFRIARSLGFEVATVDAGHVAKMRAVLFGDDGKTDLRDPRAIEAVAERGRVIVDQGRPMVYELLRGWGKLYHDAEAGLIAAKSRIHRGLTLLFPDFAFSTDFLYSSSGHAILRCYRFDPHAIVAQSLSRLHARLRNHSNIRRSSCQRLLEQARRTVTTTARGRMSDLLVEELALAWQDLELAEARRGRARAQMEALYRRGSHTGPKAS